MFRIITSGEIMELNKRNTWRIILIIAAAAALLAMVINLGTVFRIIGKTVSVFMPFFIGLCIAFAVNSIMMPLERMYGKRKKLPDKFRRPLCLAVSFLAVAAALSAVLFVVIPKIRETAYEFSKNLPQYFGRFDGMCDNVNSRFHKLFPGVSPVKINAEAVFSRISEYVTDGKNALWKKVLDTTASLASWVASMIISLVFSVYLLARKEKLIAQASALFSCILPKKIFLPLEKLVSMSADVFSKYLSGQVTEGVIIGALCYIGMKLFRFPYAAVSSVTIGVTALVPVFGALFGTAVGAFLIFMQSPVRALWFIVFVLCLQQIEGNIIYPRVVGKSVGLPGVWVLISTTLGGRVFGVAGMFFAVPVFSVAYSLLKDFVKSKAANT